MSENERRTKAATAKMLRRIKTGDRVTTTMSSSQGPRHGGTVIDPEPFSADGVRRLRVAWDNGGTLNVLPSSIDLA